MVALVRVRLQELAAAHCHIRGNRRRAGGFHIDLQGRRVMVEARNLAQGAKAIRFAVPRRRRELVLALPETTSVVVLSSVDASEVVTGEFPQYDAPVGRPNPGGFETEIEILQALFRVRGVDVQEKGRPQVLGAAWILDIDQHVIADIDVERVCRCQEIRRCAKQGWRHLFQRSSTGCDFRQGFRVFNQVELGDTAGNNLLNRKSGKRSPKHGRPLANNKPDSVDAEPIGQIGHLAETLSEPGRVLRALSRGRIVVIYRPLPS